MDRDRVPVLGPHHDRNTRRDDEHLTLIMEAEPADLLAAADIGADTEWRGEYGNVAVRVFPAPPR